MYRVFLANASGERKLGLSNSVVITLRWPEMQKDDLVPDKILKASLHAVKLICHQIRGRCHLT